MQVDDRDVVLRGVIDLVFEETDGWVIVDYKTDDRTGTPVETLVDRYAPQVRAYAQAWEELGLQVHEVGLFFVHSGAYRLISPATVAKA
jgi:ATP-dependent helicase/nuclease subunit A